MTPYEQLTNKLGRSTSRLIGALLHRYLLYRNVDVKEDSIQQADQQRAEYEEASKMAQLYGGYRFQLLGFFATIMTALVGGT